jgi:hypothetical protein
MGYSIEVCYPNGKHLPSGTWSQYNAIVSAYSIRLRKLVLTQVINNIFDGKDEAVFGVNRYVEHGDPLHITLSAKKWQ